MILYLLGAGGPKRVRRLIVLVSIALSVLLPTVTRADGEKPGGPSNVTVHEERGVYVVKAVFHVPQPSRVAFAVLTDYDGIARFMPDIDKSIVLERATGHVVVEQEAVSRVMMFSKRVHLVLEITEQASGLIFRDRCGRSFDRYEGSWRITEEAGTTHIVYELVARPSFDVPRFILKRLLERNSAQMIEQLRREIAMRGRFDSSAGIE